MFHKHCLEKPYPLWHILTVLVLVFNKKDLEIMVGQRDKSAGKGACHTNQVT